MSNDNTAARSFTKVLEILEEHDFDEHRIVSILQAVQAEYRYLPQSTHICSHFSESITGPPLWCRHFYSHFSLEPKGKHIIKMCDGTACHVRGSKAVIDAVREKLGLSETKITTNDLMFTFETVACLGACGLAPVMVIDEEVHGMVTPEEAIKLIEAIMETENA